MCSQTDTKVGVAWLLGLVVMPTYHKKEGATIYSGAHRQSLQYHCRPYWHFWLQVRTWHIGSLS